MWGRPVNPCQSQLHPQMPNTSHHSCNLLVMCCPVPRPNAIASCNRSSLCHKRPKIIYTKICEVPALDYIVFHCILLGKKCLQDTCFLCNVATLSTKCSVDGNLGVVKCEMPETLRWCTNAKEHFALSCFPPIFFCLVFRK